MKLLLLANRQHELNSTQHKECMKIKRSQVAVSLAEIGFSQPTLARLKVDGIKTTEDLIKREESITSALIESGPPQQTAIPSIYALPLLGNMLSILTSKAKTIPELLALDPEGEIFWYCKGTRVYATVALVELGYTEKDGPFLSKQSFARFMRKSSAYRFVVKLAERGKLSSTFKRWFNESIEGHVYNADNRPNRKFTVKPFKLHTEVSSGTHSSDDTGGGGLFSAGGSDPSGGLFSR